ncbi:unnamed protein product [Linum tenue]|uniref:S-protein homolog n=1 Tax=Linum tenue TaxID=586396 RepID=A0AAV0LRB5_9ROSI|nr:unnamed protein product [Linum tenue]
MGKKSGALVHWLLLLSTLLTHVLVDVEAHNYFPKTKVVISNQIEGGPKLLVHCKSSEDDLGVRWLDPGQSFVWTVPQSFFVYTEYFCAFRWEDGAHLVWFDIYKPERDHIVCKLCQWAIRRDGPCLAVPGSKMCYHWTSHLQSVNKLF